MIREGTAAHNLEALVPILFGSGADRCMFCTDDKHPNDLLKKGHIDFIIKRASALGADPIVAVKAASFNAAQHFGLSGLGAIAPGYTADFSIIDSFESFRVERVYKRGVLMFDGGMRAFPTPAIVERLLARAHNSFKVSRLTKGDFALDGPRGVIGLVPGEIVSNDCGFADKIDTSSDILKIAVIERHKNTHHIGIGYIKGYGLKHGAVATSIAHDSHNIIAVGTSDEEIAAAIHFLASDDASYITGQIIHPNGGQVVNA